MSECKKKPNRSQPRRFKPSDIRRIMDIMRNQGVGEVELRKAINAAGLMSLDDVARGLRVFQDAVPTIRRIRYALQSIRLLTSGMLEAWRSLRGWLSRLPKWVGLLSPPGTLDVVSDAMAAGQAMLELADGLTAPLDDLLDFISELEAIYALALTD